MIGVPGCARRSLRFTVRTISERCVKIGSRHTMPTLRREMVSIAYSIIRDGTFNAMLMISYQIFQRL